MRMAKDGCEASHFRPLNHIPVFSLRCVRAHICGSTNPYCAALDGIRTDTRQYLFDSRRDSISQFFLADSVTL